MSDQLARQLAALSCSLGLSTPAREVYGIKGRKFRFDWAWCAPLWVAVEYQGGTDRSLPSHSSPAHIQRDCEKLALAQLNGWLIIPVTRQMVEDGRAARLVEQALRQRLVTNS